MASSDDEGEQTLSSVNEYYFIDENDEPISISGLPIKWDEKETLVGKIKEIFLKGDADNGLQKIHKQVKAWNFDLSLPKPEISVLTTKNEWYKLLKPRKSFQDTIRSVLITVHYLHLLKKKPDLSEKALWDNLSKNFSTYEPKPSENDLVDEMAMISEAVHRDENLEKSDVLVTFLKKKPRKKKFHEEDAKTSNFIVDDDMSDGNDTNDENEEDGSEDEDEDDFDSVCSICDNGGELLCCEGKCLRSFHATRDAGFDANCKSLGLSDEEVKRIQNFLCKNCQYKQHQCYVCGKLGSSDKLSGAEVFRCVIATCGRFYHPHCVAKLCFPENETKRGELRDKIAVGGQFACPVHECYVCKQAENKDEKDLQFAVCRRCPKSYHRKCLPREIGFEEDEDEDILQRAWENLLPNKRILIYCLDHEIDESLCTPSRNHIIFPGLDKKKKAETSLSIGKKKTVSSEDSSRNGSVVKKQKGVEKLFSATKQGNSSKITERRVAALDSLRKQKALATAKKTLNKSSLAKVNISTTAEGQPSLGERLYALINKDSEADEEVNGGEPEQTQIASAVAEETDSSYALDADSVKRILSMMEDVASSVTLEKIEKNCKVPTTNAYSSKFMDKSITLGKVEAYIEAIRAALLKLEEGGSIEDAKSVCEPRFLNQIMKWRDKLKVHLAPFLYGMRYTSFGRHFTKVDKLKEIGDKLRWYVQDGDMIVDFCCGSNDFSCIMKEKLDEMGKSCSYKNYDIYPPKNDFNFEKRDWMTVQPKELPPGSKLIMGLNPPFGLNARLATQFIDKALRFKPKLLILIVPRETERLDGNNKKLPYDLVWEDDELLAGKSFYLPGSIDVNDKQMEDWNVSTTPLYLWSHPDWTSKHKSIAQQHGHITKMHEKSEFNQNHNPMTISDHSAERPSESLMPVDDSSLQNKHERSQEQGVIGSESLKGGLSGAENAENHGPKKTQLNENSRATNHGKGKRRRGSEETIPEDKSSGKRSATRHSSPGNIRGRSLDNSSSKPSKTSPHTEIRRESHRRSEHKRASESKPQWRTRSGGNQDDDMRRYSMNGEEHMSRYGGNEDDDMRRRYRVNNKETMVGVNNIWSNASSPGSSYGFRVPNEPFMTYQRDTADVPGYRTIASETDQYRRDSYIREQVQLFGRQDPADYTNQRSSYSWGSGPVYSSSYAQLAPAANLSSHNWTSTSTMQRYAPRLDELNHTRVNPIAPEPHLVGGSGIYDPRVPHTGFRSDTLGFASGPYRPFSANGSSGWLNE